MPKPPANLPLRLPREFYYECIQCGRSCSAFGEVPVDRESEDRIESLDLETLLPSEDRRPPVVDSPIVPGRRILKQVRGHCCFLSLDKKCLIHQRHDKETKPQACQDFPFRYVATPGGDFVGLSFACTAVLEEKGPLVEEQGEALLENRKRSISRRSISLPVHLADRIPLRWSQYERIEADLQEILEVETQPIENRLIAQNLYLRLLEDFVREANAEGLVEKEETSPEEEGAAGAGSVSRPTGAADAPFSKPVSSPLPEGATAPTPNPEIAEEANPAGASVGEAVETMGAEEALPDEEETAKAATTSMPPAETPDPAEELGQGDSAAAGASLEGVLPPLVLTDELLETFRGQMSKNGWNRLFTMAFKRLEQPLLMRSFLGQIIAFRQTLGKEKRGRLASVLFIFATYIRQAFRMGGLFLMPLPRALEWKEIRKTKIDFADPYFAYTVKRFFQHSIFRKDLLLESNLRLAHGFLLMNFGLWRYYTSALAALEGVEKAERRHLLEGLFNVEKFYVFHSSFNTLFSRYPWWRASVESAMNSPAYPASMTRAAL